MEITGNISVSVLQFVLLQDVGADTLFSFPFSAYFPQCKGGIPIWRKRNQRNRRRYGCFPEKITPSPFQARTVFDEGEIKKLAVSILQNGLLQPISVRPTVDGRYQLIAGERRLRACKLTGMETIPAIIYHFEDEKTAALSLLENLQREQLGPFEQARSLRDLLNLWNCTQEAGARSWVWRSLHWPISCAS